MSEATTSPGADAPQPLTSRTVPFRQACRELGVGKTLGYELARAGRFPVPVIVAGRKLLVARADLERLLGGDGAR